MRRAALTLAALALLVATPALAQRSDPRSLLFASPCASDDALNVPVNVRCLGAVGDGVADDTAALQAALNRFTNGTSATASGDVRLPSGTYRITSPLVYGGSPSQAFHLSGAVGGSEGAPSTSIVWAGPAGLPMFILSGAAHVTVENLDFNGGSSATYGIYVTASNTVNATLGTAVSPGPATVTPSSMTGIAVGSLLPIDFGPSLEFVFVTATGGGTFTATFAKGHSASAQVGHSAGTFNVRLNRVSVNGIASTATSAAVVLGRVSSGPTDQVNDIRFDGCFLYGGAGNLGIGLQVVGGGNVKNFSFSNGFTVGWAVGLDFSGSGPSGNAISNTTFSGNVLDVKIGAGGGSTRIEGCESEGGTQFLFGGVALTAPQQVLVQNCSWQGNASLANNDWVIQTSVNLTLIGNQFFNGRSPGVSVAKVSNGGLVSGNHTIATTSIGNLYQNAPAGYAPLYDGSNNALLPAYFNSQPTPTVSLNDLGGTSGSIVHLSTYVPAAALTSWSSSFVAQSGVLRAGTADTAVAFRNNANTGDVPGLSKTAGDVTVVGGPAGMTTTSSTFATLGTPADGTLLYCSNCTVANPCAAGGTGALAKRLNGTWICN